MMLIVHAKCVQHNTSEALVRELTFETHCPFSGNSVKSLIILVITGVRVCKAVCWAVSHRQQQLRSLNAWQSCSEDG